MTELPAPLVPADVDLRDMLIPREFFACFAVETLGISYEVARQFVDATADRIEEKKRFLKIKGRQH